MNYKYHQMSKGEINSISQPITSWGGTNKKKNGRLLDGKEYNEMPKPEVVL